MLPPRPLEQPQRRAVGILTWPLNDHARVLHRRAAERGEWIGIDRRQSICPTTARQQKRARRDHDIRPRDAGGEHDDDQRRKREESHGVEPRQSQAGRK